MQDAFDEIRHQIQGVRKIVGELSPKVGANALRLDEHASKIEEILDENAGLLERVRRLEAALKIPPVSGDGKPVAFQKDKASPHHPKD